MVYVLNVDRTPLMPCSNVIARLLLKDKKAKVKHRIPFTIQLLQSPDTTYLQPLVLGMDTGSGKMGSAVVNEQGIVVYASEITIRNDISKRLCH